MTIRARQLLLTVAALMDELHQGPHYETLYQPDDVGFFEIQVAVTYLAEEIHARLGQAWIDGQRYMAVDIESIAEHMVAWSGTHKRLPDSEEAAGACCAYVINQLPL